jgi:hypothetical protein
MTAVQAHVRDALRRPDVYSFVPGKGYFQHDKQPMAVPGKGPVDRCSPPNGTQDGTIHLLKSPGSDKSFTFRWMQARRVWVVTSGAVMKAHRLGFTDIYLSRAGWIYVGPKN